MSNHYSDRSNNYGGIDRIDSDPMLSKFYIME